MMWEERIWHLCGTKSIANEIHFLLECHAYTHIIFQFHNLYRNIGLPSLLTSHNYGEFINLDIANLVLLDVNNHHHRDHHCIIIIINKTWYSTHAIFTNYIQNLNCHSNKHIGIMLLNSFCSGHSKTVPIFYLHSVLNTNIVVTISNYIKLVNHNNIHNINVIK